MLNSYGELCTEVYELSKPVGYSFGDIEYYAERLQEIQGKILEIACGSGRVLIPLLSSGLKVEGIDNSLFMLEACRRKCGERGLRPRLFEGDMRQFNLEDEYEALIIPGGSLQLIESRADIENALKCYYDHLGAGGMFIADIFLETDFEINTVKTRLWETENEETITLEEKRIEVNLIEQRTVSLLKYEKWKDGHLIQSELQRFPLRWYGVHEFRMMLEKAGFSEIVISGNYEYGAAPEHAEHMITFEARKGV
ncbi:class I SAM-dependent methyltransferase [Paenibacillus bouchesdurhonensis]|uniref:class I SAM-dependent methyltransferase n=1 Tax=Paenibacillus bouchesdurhonensis TaxID=1870990 RepID=UPI000DA6384C|nr:class I SAM-dependent methyltransferase [Paenibacillus bouchesdurhonensis]